MKKEKSNIPKKKKATIFKKITNALALACQVILSAPLKLPGKLLSIVKYLALATSLLKIFGRQPSKRPVTKSKSVNEN